MFMYVRSLEPYIFLLYIHDLRNPLTYFSMLIYADGIQILPLAPDMHNLTSLIKSDLNLTCCKVCDELKVNKCY